MGGPAPSCTPRPAWYNAHSLVHRAQPGTTRPAWYNAPSLVHRAQPGTTRPGYTAPRLVQRAPAWYTDEGAGARGLPPIPSGVFDH